MRINSARKKLLEGGIISGPSLLYASPEIAEEAAHYGFDFVVIDWQHGAWSEASINNALACFVNVGSVPLVRIPSADPIWVGRMLDLGALGIVVPVVETPEQCAAIVRAAKFPPRGSRSATGLRTAYHANHDYFEYVEGANDQILTIVMVETPLGVRNAGPMMAIPDIDCVLIGPYDLTRSAGGSWPNDPRVEALVQEVLARANEKGVAAGYYTNDPAEAQMRADQGFRMVFLGHDMAQLPLAFQEMKRGAAQLGSKPAPPSNEVHPADR